MSKSMGHTLFSGWSCKHTEKYPWRPKQNKKKKDKYKTKQKNTNTKKRTLMRETSILVSCPPHKECKVENKKPVLDRDYGSYRQIAFPKRCTSRVSFWRWMACSRATSTKIFWHLCFQYAYWFSLCPLFFIRKEILSNEKQYVMRNTTEEVCLK